MEFSDNQHCYNIYIYIYIYIKFILSFICLIHSFYTCSAIRAASTRLSIFAKTFLICSSSIIIYLSIYLSLNVKQFYLTNREDQIRCYYSQTDWTWEEWQGRGTLHSPEFHHYWSLTFGLFSVISRGNPISLRICLLGLFTNMALLVEEQW